MPDTRQATSDELADSLINVLVDLMIHEPELVSDLAAAGRSPWDIVETWHLLNNCKPLRGLDDRLALALHEA